MQSHAIRVRWYTRRAGVVRGPFTDDELTRNLLLGRLCRHDEVSRDGNRWTSAESCQSLLPPEFQQLSSWEEYQCLVIARMQIDERRGERRRQQHRGRASGQPQRRLGNDRRKAGIDLQASQYLFNPADKLKHPVTSRSTARPLLLALLMLALVFAWLMPAQR